MDAFGGSPPAQPLSIVSRFNGPSDRLCVSGFCLDVETRVVSVGVQDRQSCLHSSTASTRRLRSVQSHWFGPVESPWSGGSPQRYRRPWIRHSPFVRTSGLPVSWRDSFVRLLPIVLPTPLWHSVVNLPVVVDNIDNEWTECVWGRYTKPKSFLS